MSGTLRLSLLIEAIDRASAPLTALQARLGRVAAGVAAVGAATQRLGAASGATILAGALGNVAGRARDAAGAVAGLAGRLAIGGAAGAFAFNRLFIQGAAESENFRTRLDIAMGSVEAGGRRFTELSAIARDLRFPTNQVMEAGLSLDALGVRGASANRTLAAAADASVRFNMSMSRAVDALASATRGEMDPIEAFGIRSRTEGNRIIMQWEENGRRIRATVDKNNPAAIAAVVTRAWQGRARGAAAAAGNNWDRLLQQISAAWSRFSLAVMNAGPFDFLKQQLRDVLAWVEEMEKNGNLERWAREIGAAITGAFQAIRAFVLGTEDTPGAVERLSAVFERVSRVLAPVVNYFGGLETFLVAVGLVLAGPLIGALVSLTSAMAALGLVLALTPAGWFAIAAAGIVALGVALASNWDSVVDVFGRLGAAWERFANSEQIQTFERIMTRAATAISNAWSGLTGFISRVFAPEIEAVRTLVGWVERLIALLPSLPSIGRQEDGPVAPQGQRRFGQRGSLGGFYGPEALPGAGAAGAMPPANDVRIAAGLEVVIRAPDGVGTSVNELFASPNFEINPRRGSMRTP